MPVAFLLLVLVRRKLKPAVLDTTGCTKPRSLGYLFAAVGYLHLSMLDFAAGGNLLYYGIYRYRKNI